MQKIFFKFRRLQMPEKAVTQYRFPRNVFCSLNLFIHLGIIVIIILMITVHRRSCKKLFTIIAAELNLTVSERAMIWKDFNYTQLKKLLLEQSMILLDVCFIR